MPDRNPTFAQGIARPVQQDGHGSLRTVIGDDYLTMLVQIMVQDCESNNPFQQDLGVGVDAVFGLDSDIAWKGLVRRRLEAEFRIFNKLNLAKFGSLEFRQGDVEGEYLAVVKFRSIETNTDLEVTTTVRST